MKISNIIILAISFLFGNSVQALEQTSNTLSNPTVGIELTKPKDWYFLTASQNLENIKRAKFEKEGMQDLVQKYSTAPLVVMTKYKEPYDDVNPSFKVNIKPYGQLKDLTPIELIDVVIKPLNSVFKDFEVVQAPTEAQIDGIKSAYARFNYNLQTNTGDSYPTTSELWIVPHGNYFFMIGAGTRQDEKSGTRQEIQNILSTIKIAK